MNLVYLYKSSQIEISGSFSVILLIVLSELSPSFPLIQKATQYFKEFILAELDSGILIIAIGDLKAGAKIFICALASAKGTESFPSSSNHCYLLTDLSADLFYEITPDGKDIYLSSTYPIEVIFTSRS